MAGSNRTREPEREVFLLEGVGVFETDLQSGLVTRANRTFCSLLGYTEAELRGLAYAALTGADPAARTGPRGGTAHFRRKDGAALELTLHVTTMDHPDGAYALTVAQGAERGAQPAPPGPAAFDAVLAAPVMMWATDPDGACTFLSRSWYDFTGQSPAAGLGLGWLDAVHPDDRELMRETFLAANRGGRSFRLDYRLRRRDGHYRWAIDAATPHYGPDGAFLGFIGSVIDITERKEAENALRASEARYRDLFRSIDEGFCVIELLLDDHGTPVDYRFLELNPAFSEKTGFMAEKALGRTMRELVPEPEAFWFETYGRVALTGEPIRFVRESRALGRSFDIYAFRLGGPESLRVAILFNDITERLQLQEALRSSLSELETIYRTAPVGLALFDPEGRYRRVNDRLAEINGVSAAEHLGRTVREVVPAVAEQVEGILQRVMRTGRPVLNLETVGETAAQPGTERVWNASWYPLKDAAGAPAGVNVVVEEVTERKRAEAALRDSEARYRGLFRSIDAGFCIVEIVLGAEGRPADYRFLELNPAFAGQTGLDAEGTLGKTALEVIPDLEPFWVETYGRVALTGEPARFTNASEPMGRWFEVYAFRLGGSESLKVAILFNDVTERKEAEAALAELNATLERRVAERTAELRRSEQRFTQAFNAGPVAACITSLDLQTVLETNEAFARLTGFRRDEAVGQPLGFWVSAADAARLEGAVEASGGVGGLELKLRTKTGEVCDVLLSAATIRLEDHYGYLTMFYDVTERNEAEAERELLRGALDAAEESVMVAAADPQGPRIVYVNAAFETMTGYTAAEVLGKTPRILQGPESDVLVGRRMQRELQAGGSTQGEVINYRKDGSRVVLLWTIAPIRNANGAVTHYVLTQRDVTKRRALEREFLDLSAREQRRIADDLHDSVQQQLVGTALEAKRLAALVHERLPELGPAFDGLYAHVQASVREVRGVLGDLTPVQPTENGLMVALENLCRRVTRLFGVPCRFSFEEPLLVRDFARATHLFFIAQEAAINAAKHAAAGRIDVRLSGTTEHFTLSVADDGSGVNEGVLQGHRGTGFELMEERARLLGVPLEVRSEPGRGTTVSVSLADGAV